MKESDHPEFEELFDLWPNDEKDRGKALGAWINRVIRNGVDPDLVVERAELWVRYWRRKNTKFIPYLGKWLADSGWEDKPPASRHDAYHDHINELAASRRDEQDDPFLRTDHYTCDPDSPD